MGFSKYLITSLVILCGQYSYAACSGSDCFNQGIDFANQSNPGSSSINNSFIESAVGSAKVSQAVANQDSIKNAMGGSYKNIDGINNSGQTKAQNCVGKNTDECSAYNFYNDPLTRQAQQGVESAVGVASDLINKKIEQNVNITDYCAKNPNDTICKMCQKDPNQSMCQNGNKCTTITYTNSGSSQTSNACEIIGQRSYDCSSWVDDVLFHYDYVPPSPADGTVLAQGQNQDTSKTFCSVNAQINSYEYLTNLNQVTVTVFTRNDDYPYNQSKTFNISMDVGSSNYVHFQSNNGNTNKTVSGNISGASCTGGYCSMTFVTSCNHHQLGGNDWDRTTAVTLSYAKPKISSNTLVIDKVSNKDNCAR